MYVCVCVYLQLESLQGSLQVDVLKLQKENLLLEREKLHLQIYVLKRQLARLQLEEWLQEFKHHCFMSIFSCFVLLSVCFHVFFVRF